MRAVVVTEPGGPEVLRVMEVADPEPGPDEIRVRVGHSACNRADIMQRLGGYPDPVRREHEILGLEYAGRVEAVGERVTRWSVGDRVMGIEAGACNAELVVTHDMRQRKGIMDERSDGFLALPGGIGTLEELMEVWTSRSLTMHDKPVVVLDPWDDYALLRAQVADWVERGFVSQANLDRVHWTTTVNEALDALTESGSPGGISMVE